MKLLKIAILGPESTGKTALSEALAFRFSSDWVPEFARSYLAERMGQYEREDVLFCVAGQRALEETKAAEAKGFLFCDTDMINFKVWLTDKYGSSPEWITENLRARYDAYLLTAPDLPFAEDPLRENPHRRDFFFEWYRREIAAAGIPYRIVRGTGEERIQHAVEAVIRLRDLLLDT